MELAGGTAPRQATSGPCRTQKTTRTPRDFCAVYAATEAQAGSGRGIFAGFSEQYTCFNTFQSDGRNAPNPDAERRNSLNSQLFVGYNFRNCLGVQFNTPILYREFSRSGAHGSEFGFGDALLIGNFRPYKKRTVDFSFNLHAVGAGDCVGRDQGTGHRARRADG